jgi:hypothetical protein
VHVEASRESFTPQYNPSLGKLTWNRFFVLNLEQSRRVLGKATASGHETRDVAEFPDMSSLSKANCGGGCLRGFSVVREDWQP